MKRVPISVKKETEYKKPSIEVMAKGVDEKEINGNCCAGAFFAMR